MSDLFIIRECTKKVGKRIVKYWKVVGKKSEIVYHKGPKKECYRYLEVPAIVSDWEMEEREWIGARGRMEAKNDH